MNTPASIIFSVPYHDPAGLYNLEFQKHLTLLKTIFVIVCLSVTSETKKRNKSFIDFLKSQGIQLIYNNPKSSIGDHSRNAIKLAIQQNIPHSVVFFGFLDRVLFNLTSSHKEQFVNDIQLFSRKECVIFQRSPKAWKTHPNNYQYVERTVSGIFQLLTGQNLELNPCAFLLSHKSAKILLDYSTTNSWAIWGEWVLLAITKKLGLTTPKVNWLSWEDPFWSKQDLEQLKKTREVNPKETLKRLHTNLPIIQLLLEERFKAFFLHHI